MSTDPKGYAEPRSMEEARSRRASLTGTNIQLQTLLSLLAQGKDGSGQPVSRRDALRARAETLALKAETESELQFLKGWITAEWAAAQTRRAEEKTERRRWAVIDDGPSRIHEFNLAVTAVHDRMSDLVNYIRFLEREVIELRAENERLKAAEPDTAPIEF